ncbi:hypothetical protein [Desulfovibrio sp. X2]|uniref:hypothetical protein n=1 Tax=Desulfovibrio sp. X2 TaxID=941449 RepID=UPI001267A155|nr:hypothetical protein [Desulfovibrio sp. X2]
MTSHSRKDGTTVAGRGLARLFCAALLALLLLPGAALAARAPSGMAGIRLGDKIDSVADKVLMSTAMRMWGQEYLSRVDIAPLPGFRSGYVSYGDCLHPGRIVRMKFNYEDGSRGFFDKLLAALKARYGSNPQWRGDAFGTLRVWKWSLKRPDGTRVSLILENYSGDDDSYSRGTSIRLSVPEWIDEEAGCWQKKAAAAASSAPSDSGAGRSLDWYLPME